VTEHEMPNVETPAASTTVTPDAITDTSLAEAKAEAQRNLEGWQRERADFANYKRRKEAEQKEIAYYSRSDVFKTLLPAIDDLERALQNTPAELKGTGWLNGLELVHKKFIKLLEESGVTVLDPVGQPFNPNHHEALGDDAESEHPSGYVSVTLQKGYLNGDKVLRPALVRVVK
jgi:molecular chaperone GrpE